MKTRVLAASLAFVFGASAATAATIDFSTNNGTALEHGDFVDGSFDFGNGLTGTITTTGGSGTAQVYDSRVRDLSVSPANRDDDLYFGPNSPLGNVLIVNENRGRADDNVGGGQITFLFDSLVEFTGVTLVDLELDQPVTITGDGGYNSGPLNTATLSDDGDNLFRDFSAGTLLTRTLTFSFAGSGAIDNLQVTAVPLPASAAFLLGGIGIFGVLRRRKRS